MKPNGKIVRPLRTISVKRCGSSKRLMAAGRGTLATTRFELVLLVAVLLLCPRQASAQQIDRLAGRLDPPTARAVGMLLDSARALSLPEEPLVQKAFEGASKGAESAAIITAVRGLLHDLERASAALKGETPVITLELAASALQAGASATSLERLRAYRTKRSFDGALTGLVYLMSRGVSNDAAVNILAGMLDAGLSPSEFVSLQRLVEQDVRSGVPPADAARLRSRALIQRGPGFGPADPGGGALNRGRR